MSAELSDKSNFSESMKAYTKNDSEKMKSYAETLFRIAQTIQNGHKLIRKKPLDRKNFVEGFF